MRVLLIHNFYQQAGGEDSVFAAEGQLLESSGHEVVRYTEHNDDVAKTSQLSLAAQTIWSRKTTKKLGALVDDFRPEVVHFHNTLPLISPSAYYAASKHGARIVQTLHNYRLFCPPSLFLRDGKVCEECLGKTFATPAIKHACYRGNRAATTVVSTMLATHKLLNTYLKKIDIFIALTEFSKSKFVEGGFPEEKIVVKPHFIEPVNPKPTQHHGYALYVGRLSEEKGIQSVVRGWVDSRTDQKLIVVGDGPLQHVVTEAISSGANIEWVGRKSPDEVRQLMIDAAMVVVPSECYETFGRVIMEAFAVATPVIVSRIGAIAELVDDRETGLLFEPGNTVDLMQKIAELRAGDLKAYGIAAQEKYFRCFTPEANYEQLMEIYGARENQNAGTSKSGVRNVA